MNNELYDIEYARWGKVVVKSQMIIASVVCVIEILNNILLYLNRAQGYGPDTIVEKLGRYLLLTSAINFGLVWLSYQFEKRIRNEKLKRYLLMFFMVLLCTDVALSHYQFSICFGLFVVPIIMCTLYEDWKLTLYTLILSLAGELTAVLARGFDPEYNHDIGPEAAIAFAFALCVFVFALIISDTMKRTRNSLKEAVIAIEKGNASTERMVLSMNMLETLANTIDAKDKYTNGHSLRVSIYATKLAQAMGWDESKVFLLRYEALLHDIGKIGVPDTILNKPSRLTEEEFELVKSHTVVGSDILKKMIVLPGASDVARHHHERYDGRGYPDGLSGSDIPINARIVCVADAYDAMNSNRVYRKALNPVSIRAELIGGRGAQFDPELLDTFVALFDAGELVIPDSTDAPSTNEEQDIMDDINKLLQRLNDLSIQYNSIHDFDRYYQYMKNIGRRYHRSVEVLQIDVVKTAEGEAAISESEVSDILSGLIHKCIRGVDVHNRFTDTRHMVILLDAGLPNVDIVKGRIEHLYKASEASKEYQLVFSVFDYMEAPEEVKRIES